MALALCPIVIATTMSPGSTSLAALEMHGMVELYIAGNNFFVQTVNLIATFMIPLDNQCRRCIDDQQRPNAPINPITHCEREFNSVIIYQTI